MSVLLDRKSSGQGVLDGPLQVFQGPQKAVVDPVADHLLLHRLEPPGERQLFGLGEEALGEREQPLCYLRATRVRRTATWDALSR